MGEAVYMEEGTGYSGKILPSSQFCCDPKTALNIKSLKIK